MLFCHSFLGCTTCITQLYHMYRTYIILRLISRFVTHFWVIAHVSHAVITGVAHVSHAVITGVAHVSHTVII
jgi:hypothetical protein